MKLLLTSGGVTNKAIAKALAQLLVRTPEKTRIGFIPTAANVEPGEKQWFIEQINNLKEHGFDWVDIVDPSAQGVDWRTRLRPVHAVYVGGGNTYHLLDQFRRTGFGKWMSENIDSKVYIGASAGSIIATPSIDIASVPPSDPNIPGLENLKAMSWVNFEIGPHCDQAKSKSFRFYAQSRNNPVYLLDDQSAIAISNDKITLIGDKIEILNNESN